MPQTIVIVDSDKIRAEQYERHIGVETGLQTIAVPTVEKLLKGLLSETGVQPDVVLCNLTQFAPGTIRALRSMRPDIQLIGLVDYIAIELGIQAVAEGADSFLVTPFHSAQLTVAIRSALSKLDLQLEVRRCISGTRLSLDELALESPAMQATLFLAKGMAASDSPVVLEGASGSGREMLARAIHGSSNRAAHPFYTFNAALFSPESLVSMLFGDEKPGLLKGLAGTMLIRNIEVIPMALLSRIGELLKSRMLEGEAFTGRLMFVIKNAAQRQKNREDPLVGFFSKINALPIALPNLKDMRDDIPYLSMLYARRFASLEGKTILGISAEASQMLKDMSWPGNLEQLSYGIFNAMMCCRGYELQIEDFRYLVRPGDVKITVLPERPDAKNAQGSPQGVLSCMDETGNVRRLEDVEQELIRYALDRYSGHMSEVARFLGIGRSTLYRKLSSMDDN